ncbi:MAG: membrane protein insertase YidC, partial [Pseudomonadota bacterium]
MDEQNKNLILATALSLLVILVWFALFPPPEPDVRPDNTAVEQTQSDDGIAKTPEATESATTTSPEETTETSLENAPRVDLLTDRLSGSISLIGGRIDDLRLTDYRVANDPEAEIVTLLSPVGTRGAYYALHGWAAASGVDPADVPGPNTEWDLADGDTLRVGSPIKLQWDNGVGLLFRRTISIDEDFMFTIEQSVENTSGKEIDVAPYGLVARHGQPEDLRNFFILHEGVIAMADGELQEVDWDDVADFEVDPRQGARAETTAVQNNGWIGFTDHYWMTTLVPTPGSAFRQVAKYDERRDIYQTEAVLPTQTVAAGASLSVTTQFFAGAKEWEAISNYQSAGVEGFIDSIDWGWFFFLTKPIFWLLHELNLLIGNMGWAIIGLTLIIKAVLFPLAYKSYVSMAKMKELQPQMEALKEQAGDDRQKLQQGMMELYKKERVNPAAGCLPILLQIPIFFSLYKVIFVTIELRHAPWFGPFQDLSAPDPTS